MEEEEKEEEGEKQEEKKKRRRRRAGGEEKEGGGKEQRGEVKRGRKGGLPVIFRSRSTSCLLVLAMNMRNRNSIGVIQRLSTVTLA